MDELKPCPFCGGAGEIITHVSNNKIWYSPICRGEPECYLNLFTDTRMNGYSTRLEAIKAWNTRKEEPSNEEDR